MKIFKLLAVLSLFLSVGCAPRGETKTLDQILKDAEVRFSALLPTVDAKSMRGSIDTVSSKLKAILAASSAEAAKSEAKNIADQFANLTEGAGYTTRPALGELAMQYRAIAEAEQAPSTDSVKLLVARSYNTISSELEGNKFQLRERELK